MGFEMRLDFDREDRLEFVEFLAGIDGTTRPGLCGVSAFVAPAAEPGALLKTRPGGRVQRCGERLLPDLFRHQRGIVPGGVPAGGGPGDAGGRPVGGLDVSGEGCCRALEGSALGDPGHRQGRVLPRIMDISAPGGPSAGEFFYPARNVLAPFSD